MTNDSMALSLHHFLPMHMPGRLRCKTIIIRCSHDYRPRKRNAHSLVIRIQGGTDVVIIPYICGLHGSCGALKRNTRFWLRNRDNRKVKWVAPIARVKHALASWVVWSKEKYIQGDEYEQ